MKNLQKQAFTLVELLVVITILAIISVVAYQNFGGAVDKAVSGRKINDISTIETSLQQYKVDKGSYPAVGTGGTASTTNKWGYDSLVNASPSNRIDVEYNGEEVKNITTALGGGKVMGITGYSANQIGAKGTIGREQLGKRYLTKDLYDPELGDIKVSDTSNKFIDSGIGRYTYAVYKKPQGASWASNKSGTNYNLAFTVKKAGTDTYVTKIVGDYDSESCFDKSANCPETLIGSASNILTDGREQGKDSAGADLTNFESDQANQGIPYPVADFK